MQSKPRDIEERAFRFACQIVLYGDVLTKRGGIDRLLAMQLVDAATSTGSNLEEAAAAQSKRDFIAKASIALKESRETHYWLRLLAATGRLQGGELAPLCHEAAEIKAILGAIVRNAARSLAASSQK